MIKIFKYFVQSIFIYLFFFIGKVLGISVSRKLFSKIFLFVGPLFKSKNIIDYNLNIYSSNLSNNEKNYIKSEMWKNYGMTFIEYIYLNTFRKNSSHIEIKGDENLNIAISKKKPLIFVSGHFANFELMSMELTKKNIDLVTIYRPLNNLFINPLMEKLRKKYICQNQIKKGYSGIRESYTFLKNNFNLALMIDQRVSEGILSNLFGKPAYTTTIPAQIVKKFNCEIVPVYIERKKKYYFSIEIFKPLKFSPSEKTEIITSELNKILEKMILKNPDQWIWTHDRWK